VPIVNLCVGFAVHLNSFSAFASGAFIPKLILHSGQPFIYSFMGIYSADWDISNLLVVSIH